MRSPIGIVAHNARADQAHQLQEQTEAVFLHMDNGAMGCNKSHIRTWEWMAGHAEREGHDWACVLEDDAEPVEGFRDQLEQALEVAPTPIVSLYLGDPRHWDLFRERKARIVAAGAAADESDACWLVTQELLHGVAVCIRTPLIRAMLEGIGTQAIDYAIREWAKTEGHQIAFCWPSITDHADGPTLLPKPPNVRDRRRKAWRVGVRATWTSKAVTL